MNVRCSALVDILLNKERPFIESLISALQSCDQAVAKEMRAELQLELGILECNDMEKEEASALVHRHFGSSRRMPETEKRKITNLIAMKAQVARESTKRELTRLRDDLEKYRTLTRLMETKLFDMNARVKRFIRVNGLDTPNPYIDLRSTTDALMRPRTPVSDTLTDLEERISLLMSRLMRITAEKDALLRRRSKSALDMMSPTALMPSIHITEHRVTTRAGYGLMSTGGDVINQDAVLERCMCLENELQAKDRHLEDMCAELRSKQKQVTFLRGLLQAVGLNVPTDKEPEFDMKPTQPWSTADQGRLAKAAAIWTHNKPESNQMSLPAITGPHAEKNTTEGIAMNRTNQRAAAKKTPKRGESKKFNTK